MFQSRSLLALHSANQTQVIIIIITIITIIIITTMIVVDVSDDFVVGAVECLFGSIVQRRAKSHETSISHCATLIIVGHYGFFMGYERFAGQLRF